MMYNPQDTATYSGNGQDFNFVATGNVNIKSPSKNCKTNSDNVLTTVQKMVN